MLVGLIYSLKNQTRILITNTISNFTGTGLVGAPACGDVMKLQFEVDDKGMIIDAKFKTFGCGSAIGNTLYLHYIF